MSCLHHAHSTMVSPPLLQERCTYQVSTYLMGDTEENWRLPGTNKSTKYREGKTFIFIYFADEEGQCCQDVFAVKPVTLLLNLINM